MELNDHNKKILSQLPQKYENIFRHFLLLTQIPRGSNNRVGITNYLKQWGESKGYETIVDGADNVLIRVPATSGHEKASGVCIQGHTDMVCVKTPASTHDFEKDGILVRLQDGWMYGTDTTLGADNGMGIALAMALAEDTKSTHGPLELLFTSDEEIGLVGASKLEKCLQSKYLINADSEDFGEICVSCAGGCRVTLEKTFKASPVDAGRFNAKITINDYLGGHSGVEINLYRANAIKQLGKVLSQLPDVRIVSIDGGLAHNAIPAFCSAVISVSKASGDVQAMIKKGFEEVHEAFKPKEGKAKLEIQETEVKEAFSHADSMQILDVINALPHGPQRFSQEVKDFVETSFALTVISTKNGLVHILGSGRSCYEQEIDYIYRQVESVGRLAGWTVSEQLSRYPGWPAKMDSPIVSIMERIYKKHCDHVVINAIHAGLEAGMICKLHPGMEAISVGPTIKSPHSPTERCEIDTVGRCYDVIGEVVAELAK